MKVKKIILPVFLICVLALTSVMLFGCGKKGTSADTYQLFDETISAMKADTSTFSSGSEQGLTSNFILNDVVYKKEVSSTSAQDNSTDYNQYKLLAAYGLNFIEKYYPQLKSSSVQVNFKSLNNSVNSMKSEYEWVKAEHSKLAGAKEVSGLNYNLYNGYFYNYRTAMSTFIGRVYDCANSLAYHLDREVNLAANVGNDKMTATGLEFYLDYQYLGIFEEFRIYFLDSHKGIPSDSTEYTTTKNALVRFSSEVASKDKNIDMTPQLALSLSKFLGTLKNTRDDLRQAMWGFSYHEFENSYDGSIIAYNKVNENAKIFKNNIDYYTSTTFTQVLDYLKIVAVKGN